MKNLLILLLSVFIFSCQQKPKESKYDIIEKAENEALATGINGDTIFLDFRFGMTEEEMHSHFQDLKRQGKIINIDGKYAYEFNLEFLGKRTAKFNAEFFRDSLYRFVLSIQGVHKNEEEMLFYDVSRLYINAYKFKIIDVPNILQEDKHDNLFFYGNQKVSIKYPYLENGVDVEYIDIIRDRERQKEETQKKRQEQIQNINDI